jgi:tetratricopeptide (TPR) repeat protein
VLLGVAAAGQDRRGSPDPRELFARANRLYQLDDFARAEAMYREVLRELPNSVAARYNLGNALFRQGRTGAALQQYLGALRRSPRDAAARANAGTARRSLSAGLPAGDREVIAAPPGPPASWLSPAEAAWGGVAALYVLALLAAVALSAPRARGVAAGGASVILLAAATLVALGAWARARRPDALVLAPSAQARAGPSLAQPGVLRLPEGAAVDLRQEREGWAFVSLPNGLSGWVPRRDVGLVP